MGQVNHRPTALQTEDSREPLGVDEPEPRFSWYFSNRRPRKQTAYRLLVASSPKALADRHGDVWDTGWVDSGETAVRYGGPSLSPDTRYHWAVAVRDGDGASAWSDPTWFETALDEWAADWITSGRRKAADGRPAPVFRTEFDLSARPERARLYVSGLGICESWVNGERVGDRVLDPALTDYAERVPYAVYDVTALVETGANAIGIELGRGRFALTTESVWAWHDTPWQRDEPILLAELRVDCADGTHRAITTDDTWRTSEGPTRFDSVYEGEVYDARRELGQWRSPSYDDEDWSSAVRTEGPDGDLDSQRLPPMRVVDEFEPAAVHDPEDGGYVFEFPEMVAGRCELHIDAPAGTELELRHGERRNDDGTVDIEQEHIEARIQTDRYVCRDGEQTWSPAFSYKGFRYVEVRGLPTEPSHEMLTAQAIHSTVDDDPTGEFACGAPLLERVHENSRRALLNNYHGIPTDTPMYEKNGWTGDAQLTAETALYNFDVRSFFEKWLKDLADAQRPSGEVPPIAPTSDWGYSDAPHDGAITSPNPAWDAAFVLVPWWLYRYTGDRQVLERHYDGMCSLVEFLATYAEDHILDVGLGDWLPPKHGTTDSPLPPEGPALTSTAYYYRLSEVLTQVASVLDRPDDREQYAGLADTIRGAFNDRFYRAGPGHYATGEADDYRQTSNVFPLAFDLVPDGERERVVDSLVADVAETHDGHLNTGILGTKYLLPVLTESGHLSLAYEVATQTDYPSWGHWVENGASALYEAWELDSRSLDHHMYGTVDEWFYAYLAGIRPAEPGFQTIEVRPHLPPGLDRASGTVETVRGTVGVEWERTEDGRVFRVEVPANTRALVRPPTDEEPTWSAIDEVANPGDLEVRGSTDGRWTCEIGPGAWRFETGS